MYLPHELVVLVTRRLGRRDLKSIRLVSKLWCLCASEYLFKTIYVSANKVDLEAFNAIANDPVLSTCVRRLVYDGRVFMLDLSKTAYLDEFWSQASRRSFRDQNRLWDCRDEELRDLIIATDRRRPSESEAAKQRVEDSNLVTEGYKKYHEHAVYQHDSLRDGSFVKSLAQGLRKLSLLETIQVRGRWPRAWQLDHGFGYLLARKWNPLHVYPASWVWERNPVSFAWAEPNGIGHYFIIVAALVRAQRKVRKLYIGGMAPEIFDRSDLSKPSILGLDTVAFTDLESLTLVLVSWWDGDSDQETDQETPDICPNIDGLPAMLSSMTRLKALDLYLPRYYIYKYHQVFPKDIIWTQLKAFRISNLCSKATDLVDLLTFQMPKLQDLGISIIDLSDGLWEGVIGCLKQYSKLSKFQTHQLTHQLCHDDGYVFDCRRHDHEHEKQAYCERQPSWEKEIEHYVVHGGRHPCLTPDQPDSAAEDFAKDLKPLLRCCASSKSTRITDA